MQKFQQARLIYESLVKIVTDHVEQFHKIEQEFIRLIDKEEEYLAEINSFLELHYLIAALLAQINQMTVSSVQLKPKESMFIPRIFCERCKIRTRHILKPIRIITERHFNCCRYCGCVLSHYALDEFSADTQEGRNITGFLHEASILHKDLLEKIKILRNSTKSKLKTNYGNDVGNLWNYFFNKEFQMYYLCVELDFFYCSDQGLIEM